MNFSHREIRALSVAALLAERIAFFDVDALSDFTQEKPSFLFGAIQQWRKNNWIKPLPEKGPGVFAFLKSPKKFEWWPQLESVYTAEDHERMARYIQAALPAGVRRDLKIAFHLEQAGKQEEAARLLFATGARRLLQGETKEGVTSMERVLDLLQEVERSESNNRLFLQAFVAATEGDPSFGRKMKLGHVLDEALERARDLPTDQLVIQSLLYGAMGHLGLGHMSEVEPFCDEAWERGQALDDADSRRIATLCSGTVLYLRGRFGEAIERYESTLGDTEILPEDPISLATCNLLAHCYSLSGRISRALGLLDAILEKARNLGYRSVALWARGIVASVLLESGRLRQAEEEFLRLTKEPEWKEQLIAHSVWAWGMMYLRFHGGDLAEIAPYLERLFRTGHRIGNFFNPSGYEVAVALSGLGDNEAGELGLLRFRDIMAERLEKSRGHSGSQAIIAMFETMKNYPVRITAEAALKKLQKLEQPLVEHGFLLALARLRVNQASLLYDLGRREEAAEKLRRSGSVIKECGTSFMPRQLSHVMGTESTYRLLLRAINEISKSLGTLLDRERLIRQAIDTINRLTGAERGGLFLYKGGALELVASRGLSSEIAGQGTFSASMDFIRKVATSGKGAIQEWNESPDSESPRVALAAPLILRDKIVGVIYQDNRLLRGALKEEDVDMVQAFATQMAASLENARAFAEIERLNQKLAEEKDYYQEETSSSQRSGEIVFASQEMARVVSLAAKVAETDTAVLIAGETGVGKDLVAREVHRRSARAEKPFIRVDCAAMPETLILSELFGHEKGAFTGADKSRIGRFELADGGTIFLDEIGELPAEAQAKFLRVLQEGEFERIGGVKTFKVDVRVVAATNRILSEEVRAGRFRSDLYYRLNVFPIEVPPLRKRSEDIPPLAYYFVAVSGRKLGKSFPGITQKNMKKLLSYHWPGNVRELKHVMERSAILSAPGEFTVFLPTEAADKGVEIEGWPTLVELERDYIVRALNRTGWKVAGKGGAAEVLGLNRSTLLSRMKKLGIEKPWTKAAAS